LLFTRLMLIRFISMLSFLMVAACSANTAQPSPGELLPTNGPAMPTAPLAPFWLPTPTGGAAGTQSAATPASINTPGTAATAAATSGVIDDDPSLPPGQGGGPGSAPPGQSTPAANTPGAPAGSGLTANTPPVVAVARTWLGQQLKTVESNVVLQNVERVTWPDTCLGMGSVGQGCAQVSTPGYRIIFYANGQTYEVRVDETGRTLRMLEGGKG